MDVMPGYFKWLMEVKKTYFDKCDKISGASLQKLRWKPKRHTQDFSVNNGNNPFASLLIGTWGHMPHPKFWLEFTQWVRDKRTKEPHFLPRVPGLIMDDWYG